MPYKSISELGKGKEGLPKHAKEIFMAAYNANSELGEERAHAIAWSAVKKKYRKEGDKWVARTSDAAMEVVDHCETMILDEASNLQLTRDGYLVATPRVARTGIQLYKGHEMGIDDADTVIRVYRPEGEVFDWDAVRSLAYRPITNGHPPEMVDAKNWKKYAVGTLGGDFARDGQFIRFPMTIQDSAAVAAVRAGRAQLSVGYTSDIRWEDGTTPDGEPYNAVQTGIRANHVALVDIARGGPLLKIGDAADDDDDDEIEDGRRRRRRKTGEAKGSGYGREIVKEMARSYGRRNWRSESNDSDDNKRRSEMSELLRSIVVDGVSVEVPEISAQVVLRAISDRDDDNKALKVQVDQQNAAASQTLADQRKVIDAKDGEIAALKRQLADLEWTPSKLDKLVRDRLEIVEKARAIMGDAYICDGRTDVEIKRAVVSAKLGEQAAKAMSDEAIGGAFMTLTAASGGANNLARALGDAAGRTVHSAQDAAAIAYEERNQRLQNGWRRGYQMAGEGKQ